MRLKKGQKFRVADTSTGKIRTYTVIRAGVRSVDMDVRANDGRGPKHEVTYPVFIADWIASKHVERGES